MLSVVTFKWTKPGYRSKFTLDHVATMARMVRRHYADKHRFVCFTDDVDKVTHCVSDDVPYVLAPLWSEHADVPNPHGPHNPSCYRRLRLYSGWARKALGPRVVQIDLDMVVTGDLRPLWNRPEPFVFWQDQLNRHGWINGAMQLITPGLCPEIWDNFDPANTPKFAKAAGCWGSDQGALAYHFNSDKHRHLIGRWGAEHGAYSWRVHCKPNGGELPADARIVNFHGAEDPWTLDAPWIKEHYR
jgi:hypothetical protein